MSVLHYMVGFQPEQLEMGQCTIKRSSSGGSWRLWLCVPDASNGGKPHRVQIPIIPHGDGYQDGFWALKPLGGHEWQVAPSIHMWTETPGADGKPVKQDIWHQTPKIVNVPDDEPWTR